MIERPSGRQTGPPIVRVVIIFRLHALYNNSPRYIAANRLLSRAREFIRALEHVPNKMPAYVYTQNRTPV